MPLPTRLACLVALLLLGTACGSSTPPLSLVEVASAAELPAASVPADDPRLVPAEWEQVAAWGAREVAAGRPVVINLFASWCEPCRREAPLLRDAIDEHPEVAFLLVDHMDRLEDGRAFLAEVGLDDVPSVFDLAGDVAGALRGRGMPTTAFFSASGELAALVTGELTEDVLAGHLATLLASIPPSIPPS